MFFLSKSIDPRVFDDHRTAMSADCQSTLKDELRQHLARATDDQLRRLHKNIHERLDKFRSNRDSSCKPVGCACQQCLPPRGGWRLVDKGRIFSRQTCGRHNASNPGRPEFGEGCLFLDDIEVVRMIDESIPGASNVEEAAIGNDVQDDHDHGEGADAFQEAGVLPAYAHVDGDHGGDHGDHELDYDVRVVNENDLNLCMPWNDGASLKRQETSRKALPREGGSEAEQTALRVCLKVAAQRSLGKWTDKEVALCLATHHGVGYRADVEALIPDTMDELTAALSGTMEVPNEYRYTACTTKHCNRLYRAEMREETE